MRLLILFFIFSATLLPSARILAMDHTQNYAHEVLEPECEEDGIDLGKAHVKGSCFSRLASNKWFKCLFILFTAFSLPSMAATVNIVNTSNNALALYVPPSVQVRAEPSVPATEQVNQQMERLIARYMESYFRGLPQFEYEPTRTQTALIPYSGSLLVGLELSAMRERAEQIGSLGALERLKSINILDFSPEASHASKLLRCVHVLLDRMERAKSIGRLYFVLTAFPSARTYFTELDSLDTPQLMDLHAALRKLLEFNVGLKTINMLLPESRFTVEREVLTKFYQDEKHPMDLQKFLRHPVKSQEALAVIRNLSLLMARLDFKANPWLKQESVVAFNRFMKQFIKMRPRKITKQTLLDLLSVPPNAPTIRVSNIDYFRAVDVPLKNIVRDLSFSLKADEGIHLFPSDRSPTIMDDKKLHIDKVHGQVFLRVPEANNRVVRISRDGYLALRKIQVQNALDRLDIEERMNTLFKDQTVVVSSRTKSVRSILDKAGRLAENVREERPKYSSVIDIIDINGFRITCFDSSQIISVILKLQEAGFQILELDNKYNSIRKDGAYKVLPLTLLDPKTRNIFELQITTMSSTTVTDLFHNAIYKKNAIGLDLSAEHREFVLKAQRAGAILETLNLFDREFDLARPMTAQQREKLLRKLKKKGLPLQKVD